MSQEMVKRDEIGVAKLGEIFANSGYFRDVRDQAQAVVKILYGRELGFSPVVSMMGIHIIEGKPSLSSNLMATLVKRSGHYNYRVIQNTDKICELEFLEGHPTKNWEPMGMASFTIEEAQKAGLVKEKSGWAKYPKAMLFARALSAGIRIYCPDVSACPLYVPEELGATVNEDGAVTQLPKSARQVELVEQEVVLGAPLKGEEHLPGPDERRGEPESALERKLRESLEMLGGKKEQPRSLAELKPEHLAQIGKPADDNGYISLDDQRAIHIHAKSFVSKKHEKFARTWVHDFLVTKGVVDENGEGTLTTLKKFYIKDGERLSNINRVREALEPYMKQRDADKLAEETQAI